MQIQYLTQAVTPELREWILAQVAAGCLPEDIVRAMQASGWEEAVARAALQRTLSDKAGQTRPAEAATPAAPGHAPADDTPPADVPRVPLPEPAVADGSTLLRLPDREVPVLMASTAPRVVLFGSLLSETECDALMELARPRLSRSETVDHRTGGSEVNAARTSDGMFFERHEAPLIARIEARIAALLNWPEDKGEGLQILRYRPGAEYRPHFDYFDPAQPGTGPVLKRGGQRVGTLIMYLNTPKRGGSTVFPDAKLDVAPIKGNAVFFSYDRPHESTGSLHGGSPVIEGEKWVATKWLREGVFT